ncbi:MAG TPA: hypothetical protein VN420_05895 [Candidatus Fimivivens sp.]|nr:hypothetical protein [Candidatus Fimivivens sp.]
MMDDFVPCSVEDVMRAFKEEGAVRRDSRFDSSIFTEIIRDPDSFESGTETIGALRTRIGRNVPLDEYGWTVALDMPSSDGREKIGTSRSDEKITWSVPREKRRRGRPSSNGRVLSSEGSVAIRTVSDPVVEIPLGTLSPDDRMALGRGEPGGDGIETRSDGGMPGSSIQESEGTQSVIRRLRVTHQPDSLITSKPVVRHLSKPDRKPDGRGDAFSEPKKHDTKVSQPAHDGGVSVAKAQRSNRPAKVKLRKDTLPKKQVCVETEVPKEPRRALYPQPRLMTYVKRGVGTAPDGFGTKPDDPISALERRITLLENAIKSNERALRKSPTNVGIRKEIEIILLEDRSRLGELKEQLKKLRSKA